MATRAIGIDVGGTKAALGLVDTATGTILRRRQVVTPDLEASGSGFVAALGAELAALRDGIRSNGNAGPSEMPTGLGLCEIVSREGEVQSGYRVDWRGASLSPLGPVRLVSDVMAAATAEATFGAGAGYLSFVYMNFGTGISHALVLGGKPWPGARGAALISANGPVPIVINDGIAGTYVPEDWSGGAAISARYLRKTGERLAARDVLARAAAGDPDATTVVDTAAGLAGALVAQAVNWFDPAAVILGGGLGAAGGAFGERLLTAARDGIWLPAARDLPVLPAALGADAGLIGAALVAAEGAARGRAGQSSSTEEPQPDSVAEVKR